MTHLPPVVIDNGSFQIRVGLAGSATPSLVCKSVMGREEEGGGVYFGEEAWVQRERVPTCRPLQRGRVESWDALEAVWRNAFDTHLRQPASERPVLLSEYPLTPRAQREKVCTLMFEALEVPALHLAPQSVLALLSSGRISGCVLDCGYDLTHAVPVYEGHCLAHAARRLPLGGRDVTLRLAQLLREGGARFANATCEYDATMDVKEKMCFVAEGPSQTETDATANVDSGEADYSLPDGQVIQLHAQKHQAPEILFSPAVVAMDSPGLPALMLAAVAESDADLRPLLLGNPALAGGGGLIPGMGRRMTREMAAAAPPSARVGPVCQLDSAWLGGSLLASLATFRELCVSRVEYEEMGARALLHKCF